MEEQKAGERGAQLLDAMPLERFAAGPPAQHPRPRQKSKPFPNKIFNSFVILSWQFFLYKFDLAVVLVIVFLIKIVVM